MFNTLARKVFGTRNDRILKKLWPIVNKINGLEPETLALADDALAAKTVEFRARLANGETLDALLPEAFAVVREATRRVLGTRHFDVQLLGGIILHQGKIPEMRTGEGKTQVALLPVYLNALTGKGVHVVTVNDYLAKRDADWMGRVYRFLGLTVGCIQSHLEPDGATRREQYACDITYSTNNELGFDYLRDNMKYDIKDMSHRPFNYAIIDEVDSILIDEARTPLIISGASEDTTDLYVRVNALIPQLAPEHFDKDEKQRQVVLTDAGVEQIEEALRGVGLLETGGMYDIHNMTLLHHVNKGLTANVLFRRDVDYIVKDDKIILIDPFTGRMMTGRRFGDGLHQALEAKENVTVQRENQTLASVTFQNFFRMYPKIAGMTGTALTEAGEFAEIYNLEVIEVPTHRPVSRFDQDDEIYRTGVERNKAVVKLVKEAHDRGQPVLVGTTSIEKSEELSRLFKQEKIPHAVLNARHHEQEAQIVSQAGRRGAVTVATNMAGRGTDIKLGGNAELMVKAALTGTETPEQLTALTVQIDEQVAREKEQVIAAGGLFVIGTERHESRRIDNQLRGRSGRQGDPGASKFFISLEDDLMRIFGAERIDAVLQKLGIREGQAIFHPWINTAIERAQKKIEGQHFDARRHVLRFDNVMNDQRKVIYAQRRELMTADDMNDRVAEMIEDVILLTIEAHIPQGSYKEQWQLMELQAALYTLTGEKFAVDDWAATEGIGEEEFADTVLDAIKTYWAQKKTNFTQSVEAHPDVFGMNADTDMAARTNFATTMLNDMERNVVLQTLDKVWKDHLLNLDHLRMGIGLRQMAQRDPLNEYKAEAFALFAAMLEDYRAEVVATLLALNVATAQQLTALRIPLAPPTDIILTRQNPGEEVGTDFPAPNATLRAVPRTNVKPTLDPNDPSTWTSTPRNEPCPCGSGKKYKHCHGAIDATANGR